MDALGVSCPGSFSQVYFNWLDICVYHTLPARDNYDETLRGVLSCKIVSWIYWLPHIVHVRIQRVRALIYANEKHNLLTRAGPNGKKNL